MKRVLRGDPLAFSSVDLLDAFGRKHNLPLNGPEIRALFLEKLGEALETTPPLHGQRVEAMFGYVAGALGNCVLVKLEDAGDAFNEGDSIIVPDYRVILQTGEEFLVEVKNCHEEYPSAPIDKFKAPYAAKLSRYGELCRKPIFAAIYWSRWNIWTLLPLDRLYGQPITLIEAMKANQMAMLGDMQIGTRYPLVMRFVADTSRPRKVSDDGFVDFTIGLVEVFCAGVPVTDKAEKNLALYFMLFSKWEEVEPTAKIEDGELV